MLTRHRIYPLELDYYTSGVSIEMDYYNYIHKHVVQRYKWMAAYFELGPNETNNLDDKEYFHQRRYLTDGLMKFRANLSDLQTFIEEVEQESNTSRAEEHSRGSARPSMFRTHYSVGFSRVEVERQDFIFAVDGVRTPLILRKNDGASSRYRIVGECYLWAALELDYWNPGTRKGIWSSRPYDLGQVQTRMIEIY